MYQEKISVGFGINGSGDWLLAKGHDQRPGFLPFVLGQFHVSCVAGITETMGHSDNDEYQRQLEHGAGKQEP